MTSHVVGEAPATSGLLTLEDIMNPKAFGHQLFEKRCG